MGFRVVRSGRRRNSGRTVAIALAERSRSSRYRRGHGRGRSSQFKSRCADVFGHLKS